MTTGIANRPPPMVRWWLPATLSALLVLGALGRATARPLWHDELVALYVAEAPSLAAMWQALEAGTDFNPPLYHLAVRATRALVDDPTLATRIPAALAFAAMGLCLYVFVGRRLGPGPGAIALVTPALTSASLYAYEGRPYGFVLAAAAGALLAWQTATERRGPWPLILCAASLAAAVASHYYAVLLMLPLAAAELTRTLARRRIDWAIWVAWTLGLASLALYAPLIETAQSFGPTYWAKPTLRGLLDFWPSVLQSLALPLAVTLGVVLAWLGVRSAEKPHVNSSNSAPPGFAPEAMAAVGFLLLPLAGWFLARWVTGAFTDRYVLAAVLGPAIGLAIVAARAAPAARRIIAVTLVVMFVGKQAIGARLLLDQRPHPLAAHPALTDTDLGRLPVVFSDARLFLALQHVAEPDLRQQFVYLTKPPAVVQRDGVDTGSRVLEGLSRIRPLRVGDFVSYTRGERRFLVYGPPNWLASRLRAEGYTLVLRAEDSQGLLLEARAP